MGAVMGVSLKDKLDGDAGFSLDLKLSAEELQTIKAFIEAHWLECLKKIAPNHWESFAGVGIERYHEFSHVFDHAKVWPKLVRILSQKAIDAFRSTSLFKKLEDTYGKFGISDEENIGREEIYWRLVRPHELSDVGPLHADAWFWNLGHGTMPANAKRVKVWVAICCEPGLNGLRIVPGSHQRTWKYTGEYRDGFTKPQFDETQVDLPIKLAYTEPGSAVVFNDLLLHGGAVNKGNFTRVSVEFTMFVKE